MYELERRIFIQLIELGFTNYITSRLSVSRFPESFKFYDPILFYIHLGVAADKKSNFLVKKELKLKEIREENFIENLKERFGLTDKNVKPFYKHEVIK
jgi:hypothetical protein